MSNKIYNEMLFDLSRALDNQQNSDSLIAGCELSVYLTTKQMRTSDELSHFSDLLILAHLTL